MTLHSARLSRLARGLGRWARPARPAADGCSLGRPVKSARSVTTGSGTRALGTRRNRGRSHEPRHRTPGPGPTPVARERGGSREADRRSTVGLATLVRVRYPMGAGQPERRGTGMATKKVEEGRLNVRLSKDFLKRLKVECVRR